MMQKKRVLVYYIFFQKYEFYKNIEGIKRKVFFGQYSTGSTPAYMNMAWNEICHRVYEKNNSLVTQYWY